MKLSDWIMGPQLIGFVIGVAGLIQIYFPPRKIKGLDIHSTSSAEEIKQIEDEARRFFPRYMLKFGSIIFVVGIIITTILNLTITSAQLSEGLCLMFMYITLPFIPVMVIKTNRHIEKMFYKDEIR